MNGTTSPTATAGQSRDGDHSTGYHTVVQALLSQKHVFYSPPTSPHRLLLPQKTGGTLPTISSLSLHPVIESILHLLNCDLPSAHFLCRHAEVNPKYESMFVHGILHRIEGDLDNTRAWYGDVKDADVFKRVWGAEDQQHSAPMPEIAQKGWEHFLDRLERYRDRTKRRRDSSERKKEQGETDSTDVADWSKEEDLLRETSLWEIREVLAVCEKKFGLGVVSDARSEFLGRIESGNEEHAEVAQNMVTGGEGWRTF